MAERIVSPGVFTREKDLSFLPQGISEIGAALIGPTQKGPAFTPTQISNFSEFEEIFGSLDSRFYVPYTAKQYLKSAGTVTIVRVLGIGGYQAHTITISVSGSATEDNPYDQKVLAVLAPTRKQGETTSGITGSVSTTGIDGTAIGNLTGSVLHITASGGDLEKAISFDTGSEVYIDKVIPSDPQNNTVSVYLYKNFKGFHGKANALATASVNQVQVTHSLQSLKLSDGDTAFNSDGTSGTWTGNADYQYARTPYLQSQNVGGSRYNLFRVYTRSHGTDVNQHFKINILNVKDAGSVAGSDYGTFSLQVRSVNFNKDSNRAGNDSVIEQFDNLSFNPNESNYFARVIGDRHISIDSNGKLTYFGDYPNKSKHIRVGDFNDLETFPTTVVPFGHNKVYVPYFDTIHAATTIPTASFKRNQSSSIADFDQNAFYGFNYSDLDNREYLSPIPSTAAQGNNVTMSLENMFGSDGATSVATNFAGQTELLTLSGSAIEQRKFVVPFQWGFDGQRPSVQYATGADISSTNTQGFNLNTSADSGSIVYKRAINSVSNPDEFDINMMALPGVIHGTHTGTTNHAIDKVEERADTFLILDASLYADSVDTVRDNVKSLDSNFTATYYPWVKILDDSTNRPTWVPPSVVLPGVISFNDSVAHEWFAPAGLNRGGLTDVLEAKTRLTHSERDKLYEDRVNPIATFPGQGVVVFGQKTLQGKPSALDRVNVRRLLIALKKFIASTSRFLVFEQNTTATRNRFLNVVNPFLEDVQSNSGLSAFRVVMDDTNNTPDEIDRNRLVGQIFIQPTRTAEFIVLDFVVQPTGATFPE